MAARAEEVCGGCSGWSTWQSNGGPVVDGMAGSTAAAQQQRPSSTKK